MHVVYCWEMGADLGHITQLAVIAKALQRQGHRVSAVLKDTTHALRYLQPLGVAWFQAPQITGFRPATQPLNHADLLAEHGYANATRLAGLIQAWRSLLHLLQPDCVVVEAAPTAALAARSLQQRVVALDNGFFCPPLTTPLRPLHAHYEGGEPALLAREQHVTEQVDLALTHLGLPPIERFAALFEYPTYWLTWPEINHFGYHSPERHLGPLHEPGPLPSPSPATPRERRVVAYLKPTCAASLPALQWCLANGYQVTAYLPQWPQQQIQHLLASGRITVSTQPLHLPPLLSSCDFTLCHGGVGTLSQSLSAGTPLLLLPTQAEQTRTAQNVVAQGLALLPLAPHEATTFGFDLDRFDACRLAARRFAERKAQEAGALERLLAVVVNGE